MIGNLYPKTTCKRGTEPSTLRNMYFTSSGLESNSSSKSSKNVVNGPVYHPSTYSLAWQAPYVEKTNVAVTMFLAVATGWFWFWNYHELSVIRSQRMSFRIVHMIQLLSSTTAWYERQNYGKSEPPHYYNTSTRQVIWIKLHFYKFVPGSETLPGLHWMGHPATCCNMMGMMLHWPAMYERHSEALSLSLCLNSAVGCDGCHHALMSSFALHCPTLSYIALHYPTALHVCQWLLIFVVSQEISSLLALPCMTLTELSH